MTSPTQSLSVIAVDSLKVADREEANSVGILYPGQRMDLLMRVPSDTKMSALNIEMDSE